MFHCIRNIFKWIKQQYSDNTTYVVGSSTSDAILIILNQWY